LSQSRANLKEVAENLRKLLQKALWHTQRQYALSQQVVMPLMVMNEKLNTFRTLQDLPPAVTSFWCRFNWHTWTKWSAVEHNNHSIWARQNRYCVHCYALQQKKWQVA
jgi:hypothetical protein